MKIIDNEGNRMHPRHEYEVVDRWPREGYEVWNIGRHNFEHEGYIPLAQVNANYTINPITLKALHVGTRTFAWRFFVKLGITV